MPLPQDAIELQGLSFYGYHGFHQEENKLGQPFVVDLRLSLSLREAGKLDDLEKTVDYGKVYRLVKDIVEERQFKLIEALGEAIASATLSAFPFVEELQVKVRKTKPPIPGILEGVAIEITRRREEWRESI